ncbi:MAG TPA: TetR/AcrR family transcriptional regulator [Kofleriaceae bacterium]|nr:TetR/AcrR family transcriptional regulator [Kofleriaceae bacterium]
MAKPRKPRPRAESMQETRAALIAAALEEFSRHGLDASLDGICARAGLTRGAFYVHFADREALIIAVMEHVLGSFVAVLTGVRPEVGGSERAIELFVAAARARSPAVHGGRALRFHHLMDACQRSREVSERYRRLVLDARDRIADGLAIDQQAGRIRDDVKPAALADLAAAFALGVVAALELELPLDLARLGKTLSATLRA